MSNIRTVSQYIKLLNFDIANSPQIFLNPQEKPNINLSIDLDARKVADDLYEVILKISADAKMQDQQFFNCEMHYAGLFSLQKMEGEMLEQVLLIYCPNLLFPFIRRIIANLTSDSGILPLMLEPNDFAQLYARRKEAVKATPINDTKN